MKKALTRVGLAAAVYSRIGLSRSESAKMVGVILDEMSAALVAGKTVKIARFGSFDTRQKGARVGRNPKTGAAVPIPPRRVLVFRAAPGLRDKVNDGGNTNQANQN